MAQAIRHGTLTASQVTTVEFDGDFRQVDVLNRDGADEIWFNVDEDDDPTAEGDDVNVLPASVSVQTVASRASGRTVVKMLAPTSDTKYTVIAT